MTPVQIGDNLVFEATGEHTGTLIFLHGLTSSGANAAKYFTGQKYPNIKYIFPNAPIRTVQETSATVKLALAKFETRQLPSWYHLPDDRETLEESADEIHKLIDVEIKCSGIPAERIFLGGHSQGSGLALFAGLTYANGPLGGLVLARACLVQAEKLMKLNSTIPIFNSHGELDPLLPIAESHQTLQSLRKFTPNVAYHWYAEAEHRPCQREAHDINQFMAKIISKQLKK